MVDHPLSRGLRRPCNLTDQNALKEAEPRRPCKIRRGTKLKSSIACTVLVSEKEGDRSLTVLKVEQRSQKGTSEEVIRGPFSVIWKCRPTKLPKRKYKIHSISMFFSHIATACRLASWVFSPHFPFLRGLLWQITEPSTPRPLRGRRPKQN